MEQMGFGAREADGCCILHAALKHDHLGYISRTSVAQQPRAGIVLLSSRPLSR